MWRFDLVETHQKFKRGKGFAKRGKVWYYETIIVLRNIWTKQQPSLVQAK